MNVLDLFSGCGGLSCGFLQAGYDVVGFVEHWEPAIETFRKNHPHAKHIGSDITKIKDSVVQEYENKIDIIVGGPPCQGFSMCGKRDKSDPRNKLYKEFLRFVRIVKPKALLMENVPGLLSMKTPQGESVIAHILMDLVDLGYCVNYKVLTASEHGVPQKRKRLIIVGLRKDIFPQKKFSTKTVDEALQDIRREVNGHLFFDSTDQSIQNFCKLKQGERVSSKFKFSRQRLRGDLPSRTVTTKPMYVHPKENRLLTPRELARLQSFPDDFIFCGTKTSMVKQIGNAVPPQLAFEIANQLRGELQ